MNIPITLGLACYVMSFGVAASQAQTLSARASSSGPTITPGGIVPIYSTVGTIQSGEWVSIYGTNLAGATATWTGNFPESLGGTSVTIDGKPAYLWVVSPGQINLQAPDDTATGTVPVVVTTASGSATATVTLARFAPSFSLLDSKHVTGIILRSTGSGAYDGGAYDILGPSGNSLGYATVAAKSGDSVELFAVGLGPTTPSVASGQAFSGAAQTSNPVTLLLNGMTVTPDFAGLSSAGLYQINFTVPSGLGTGDVPLQASVGGVSTPAGVVISLQDPPVTVQVQSLTLTASSAGGGNSVVGGTSVTGTINLSAPAPAGGAVVSVFSNNPIAATAPSTVTIPAGSLSATFTITTTAVTSVQAVSITASYGGASQQASLSVTPPSTAPTFSTLVLYTTFKPSGYPTVTTNIMVQPNNGTSTYTGGVPGLITFVNGTASNQGLTFTFSTLQAGLSLWNAPVLEVSSASLTFTLSPAMNTTGGTSGFSGMLSITGTPPGVSSSVNLVGPITGYYATLP